MKHMCTHRNPEWHIPGHHYNDLGEALVSSCLSCLSCYPPVCLWETDVWSTLCVSVAGSHIATLSQFLRPRSDLRSARRGEHSRLSTAPVSEPWAITLLSLSFKTLKTEEESEWEGNGEISNHGEKEKLVSRFRPFYLCLCSLKCPSCII